MGSYVELNRQQHPCGNEQPHSQDQRGLSKYCEKQVILTVHGVTSGILFVVGDGCERWAYGVKPTWGPNAAECLNFSSRVSSSILELPSQLFALAMSLPTNRRHGVGEIENGILPSQLNQSQPTKCRSYYASCEQRQSLESQLGSHGSEHAELLRSDSNSVPA